jgi:hypothetical protein
MNEPMQVGFVPSVDVTSVAVDGSTVDAPWPLWIEEKL